MAKKAKRGKKKKPAPPPAVKESHPLQIRRGQPPVPVKDNLPENAKPGRQDNPLDVVPAKDNGRPPLKKG